MRQLFLALLIVNLVYFAWARWIDAPHPVPASPALAKLPALKLVNESSLPVASLPAPGHAAATPVADPQPAAACVSIGPFSDIESSAQAAAILKGKGMDPQQRAAPGETSSGFWVYVPGLKSEEEVERVRRDLVYHGIPDAHSIGDSGAERRVSVGLFTERERAEKRAKTVRQLGIKAEVGERKLPVSMYWIDVSSPPGMAPVPIDDLIEQGVSSKVGVQTCALTPGTASVPQATAAAASGPTPAASRPLTTAAAAPKMP